MRARHPSAPNVHRLVSRSAGLWPAQALLLHWSPGGHCLPTPAFPCTPHPGGRQMVPSLIVPTSLVFSKTRPSPFTGRGQE